MMFFKYGEFAIDKRTIFMAALSILLAGASLSAETTGKYVSVPLNVSLVHKISIGHAIAGGGGKKIFNSGLALNLLTGRASKLRGVDLSGIWSEYTGDITGVQLSGIFTTVRGEATAAQLAGVLNLVGGKVSGVQGAGILNIVGDHVSGVQGAGIFNIVGDHVSGVQGAGIFNIVGDHVSGVQGASIFNIAGDHVSGVQGASIFNIAGNHLTGMQGAGILNITGESFSGIQGAGILNITGESFSGIQGAGILNITGESFSGIQGAGILNMTGENFSGIQGAGILNVVGENFSGLQCAAVLNAAVKVEAGVQIGLFNISEVNNGVPIGPVSYVKSIGFGYDLWGDEARFMYFGLRSGTERFYNVLSVGVRPGDILRWSVGWAFGGHLKISPKTALEIGGMASHINEDELWTGGTNLLNKVQVTGVFETSGGMKLFAGPSLNIWVSKDNDGSGIAPWSVYDTKSGGTWIRIWPGITGGIRF